MAATTTKLGVALLLTLTSNATLLSLLLALRDSHTSFSFTSSSSTSSVDADTATTTATTSTSSDVGSAVSSNVPRGRLSSELLKRSDGNSVQGQKNPERPAKRAREDFAARIYKVRENGGFFSGGNTEGGGGRGGGGGQRERRRRKEGRERVHARSVRSTLQRIDTGHHLEDVIASLTEDELKDLDDKTVKILIPALVGLESLVLRELERLHDASVHQELRLERLEKAQLHVEDIMEAANIIREEEYLLQRQKQKEALREQEEEEKAAKSRSTTTTPPSNDTTITVITFDEVQNLTDQSVSSELQDGDGSGSGDAAVAINTAAASTSVQTSTVNQTESSESAIINHIYEIYSSLTSMEHKVTELGTSLSQVNTELYRQRSTVVAVEDKVEELRRTQRTLAMRSTMHTFKITDLEQFRGQAELLMRTASGAIDQFESKIEVFKDRVTEQQDDVQLMRNVFSRLEQSNNELRAADAYKAHDIQELKSGAQQMQTRLNNLYHSLDRYVGNIRWDVKTYLDHVCSSNNLQC